MSTTDVIFMIHNKRPSFLPSFLGSKVALTNTTTCKYLTYNKNVHMLIACVSCPIFNVTLGQISSVAVCNM